MAALASNTAAAILIFSLLFCSTFSHPCTPCGQSPPPKQKPPPSHKPKSSPPPHAHKPKPPPAPKPKPPPSTPVAPPPMSLTCPKDTLKLGSCVDLLGGAVGAVVGTPASSKCCALLTGLADLEAAVCLCTAIKANVLGINLNVPITLSLIINACGKSVPPGFKCK